MERLVYQEEDHYRQISMIDCMPLSNETNPWPQSCSTNKTVSPGIKKYLRQFKMERALCSRIRDHDAKKISNQRPARPNSQIPSMRIFRRWQTSSSASKNRSAHSSAPSSA